MAARRDDAGQVRVADAVVVVVVFAWVPVLVRPRVLVLPVLVLALLVLPSGARVYGVACHSPCVLHLAWLACDAGTWRTRCVRAA